MFSNIKNIIRFILLVLFQVYILDKIRLHQMVTPYVYFIFILWLPFKINRVLLMLLAFILGFFIDSFRHQPGFHSAACVLMAYFRPFIVNLLIPQDGVESSYDEPSFKSMGGMLPYMIYAGILIAFHNTWLFLLEAWQFSDGWYFLLKTLLSTAISMLLVFLTELLFSRKQKYKTNIN